MIKSVLLSLLALTTMLVAGCNKEAAVSAAPADVAPTGAPLTVEQYSAKLTELGSEAQKLQAPEMTMIQDAKRESDKEKQQERVLAAFQAMTKLQDAEVAKYEAINPPPVLAKAHAVMVQSNKDIAQNFREGVAAMENKDFSRMDDLMTKLQTIATEMVKNLTAALDAAGYKMDAAGNIVKK